MHLVTFQLPRVCIRGIGEVCFKLESMTFIENRLVSHTKLPSAACAEEHAQELDNMLPAYCLLPVSSHDQLTTDEEHPQQSVLGIRRFLSTGQRQATL